MRAYTRRGRRVNQLAFRRYASSTSVERNARRGPSTAASTTSISSSDTEAVAYSRSLSCLMWRTARCSACASSTYRPSTQLAGRSAREWRLARCRCACSATRCFAHLARIRATADEERESCVSHFNTQLRACRSRKRRRPSRDADRLKKHADVSRTHSLR